MQASSVDFSKVPRVPGDGAYAPNDDKEDVEAHTTKICITAAPKLKPLQFESVVIVPDSSNNNGNTLSPSIIKHGPSHSGDPAMNTNSLSPSAAAGGDGDCPNGQGEGE